eukprot:360663-Chlamydomonas_euryale.AAC.12
MQQVAWLHRGGGSSWAPHGSLPSLLQNTPSILRQTAGAKRAVEQPSPCAHWALADERRLPEVGRVKCSEHCSLSKHGSCALRSALVFVYAGDVWLEACMSLTQGCRPLFHMRKDRLINTC